jgi:hypothetical protein
MSGSDPDLFPKWVNRVRNLIGLCAVVGVLYVAGIITYGFSPYATDVGYMPEQPLPYSHRMHAGKLGMDCRYCHNTVEYTAFASVPPTQTCYGCHANILPDSSKLHLLRESHARGTPIPWIKIHDLPDYVYFNHSAHVRRGVGCVTCHGRIDKMEVVYQAQPLSMSWCLNCHRGPQKYLRPPEEVTNMEWVPPTDQIAHGLELKERYNINPSTDCSTCHR